MSVRRRTVVLGIRERVPKKTDGRTARNDIKQRCGSYAASWEAAETENPCHVPLRQKAGATYLAG